MKYVDKLKDPRWQKRRLQILQRDQWTCQVCGSTEKTLHVHHIKYMKGYEPWDHPEYILITLCDECHQFEEYQKNSSLRISNQHLVTYIERILGAFDHTSLYYDSKYQLFKDLIDFLESKRDNRYDD